MEETEVRLSVSDAIRTIKKFGYNISVVNEKYNFIEDEFGHTVARDIIEKDGKVSVSRLIEVISRIEYNKGVANGIRSVRNSIKKAIGIDD